MAAVRVNARDLIVQVAAADGTTWLAIDGLNSMTINNAENEEKFETTVVTSGGEYEGEIMQRGASLALEGMLVKDLITGAQDSGQARCDEMATKVAHESLGKVRFRHLMDTVWKVWPGATFSPGEQGGGNNDKASWSITIARSGASTTQAVA